MGISTWSTISKHVEPSLRKIYKFQIKLCQTHAFPLLESPGLKYRAITISMRNLSIAHTERIIIGCDKLTTGDSLSNRDLSRTKLSTAQHFGQPATFSCILVQKKAFY